MLKENPDTALGMLLALKYYWKVIKASLKSTWDGFVPNKANLVKSAVTTAVFWLVLVYLGVPIFGKLQEASALAVAVVGVFVFYAIIDLFLTPAKIDNKQTQKICEQREKLFIFNAQKKVQEFLIANATVLRNLENDLEQGNITPDEYSEKANTVYTDLKESFKGTPHGQYFEYRMGDLSSHSSLNPLLVDLTSKKLLEKFEIDQKKANTIARFFAYRNNLDGIIQSQVALSNPKLKDGG